MEDLPEAWVHLVRQPHSAIYYWKIEACPYCGFSHEHGCFESREEAREALGPRVAHCARKVGLRSYLLRERSSAHLYSWFIYALADPRDQAIRYIGQSNLPERRYKQHCHALDCWNSWHYEHGRAEPVNVAAWITDLRRDGLVPDLRVLQIVESKLEADYWELDWITLGLLLGWPLVNCMGTAETRLEIWRKLRKGGRDGART